MRVLQVSKTSEGASWAARQAAELVRGGVEVHVALPERAGAAVAEWQQAGARIHLIDCGMPGRNPERLLPRIRATRRLVSQINPHLIHSHFVSTTLMLRLALGRHHPIPRIFQVPGPLHLEHWHTRSMELALAGENDFWIASSQCIARGYEVAGISRTRLFRSYYGMDTRLFCYPNTGYLRRRLKIPLDAFIVGNINLIYPPKRYLGQKIGLKSHEDVIEAISLVQQRRPNVWGVLIGGTFGNHPVYEYRLRELAQRKGHGTIIMPGKFDPRQVAQSWPDFDCAVHVPTSENCGGVVEPLLCGVPTIAGRIGGLPEVVHPGVTGEVVPIRRPDALAYAIMRIMDNNELYRRLANRGKALVSVMFNQRRCAAEIHGIYRHILYGDPRPEEFDPKAYLDSLPYICEPTVPAENQYSA